jgi:hypothetical protein
MTGPRRRRKGVSQNARVKGGGKVTQIGGDQVTHHHHYASRPSSASAAVGRVLIGLIPPAADCFQGREAEAGMAEALARGGTAPLTDGSDRTRSWVLTGAGGMGKTQMAAAYARQAWHKGDCEVVVWVTASSRPAIIAAFAAAARQVGLGEEEDPEDLSAVAKRFLNWAQSTEQTWLVVLDDIQDAADVIELWPDAQRERQVVVATTRLRDASLSGGSRRRVDVGVFAPSEARAYLTAKLAAHERSEDPDLVDALAADLGWLPLALAQAVAFMIDTGLGCAEYRTRFADRTRTLTDLVPEPGQLPDDHHAIIAAIWSLSIEQANQARPAGLARPLLDLLSVLDPNGIPSVLVTCPAVVGYVALHHRDTPLMWYRLIRRRNRKGVLSILAHPDAPLSWRQRMVQRYLLWVLAPVEAEQVTDALAVLRRYSLIDPDQEVPFVRVHQLIQRATREAVSPGRLAEITQVAADSLLALWPDVDHRDLTPLLRANTAALTAITGTALRLPDGATHPLWPRAAISLAKAGQITAAITEYANIHANAIQQLGHDHPHTLTASVNLASLRGEAGDAAGAVAAIEAVLADCVRVLGPDHLDTLSARINLAEFRGQSGDVAGAVAGLESVLTDCVRTLGLHQRTLATRNNLARWRGQAGDAAGAVAALEGVVADSVQLLGPNHPDTLSARNNLTDWRGLSGDVVGAVAALEELLADCVQALGPDHPDTLSTRGYLAIWRARSGDVVGAVAALEELLADRLRVLGPGHPDTQTTRGNLATLRKLASGRDRGPRSRKPSIPISDPSAKLRPGRDIPKAGSS